VAGLASVGRKEYRLQNSYDTVYGPAVVYRFVANGAQQMGQETSAILIPVAQVRARYGNVSAMWIERRLSDSASGFPLPRYVGRRRYWVLTELENWERSLAVSDPNGGGVSLRRGPPAAKLATTAIAESPPEGQEEV